MSGYGEPLIKSALTALKNVQEYIYEQRKPSKVKESHTYTQLDVQTLGSFSTLGYGTTVGWWLQNCKSIPAVRKSWQRIHLR